MDDMGIVCGKYRKTHLFDAYTMKESSVYEFGRMQVKPFGLGQQNLGSLICYDLRFPEPSRILRLSGAGILSYQAGWFSGNRKLETWRNLLISRAMENGAFVLGTAQCGPKFTGHTMAVSPYGEVLSELGNEEGVLSVDLDLSLIEKYLEEVPVLKERRLDLYDVAGL
jgi:predicted amidohydrolase